MVSKIDSNFVGLRYAFEETLGVLPGSGVTWYAAEPNSYGDFGAQYSSTARAPINPSRQRRKGNLTDVDVPAAFEQDFLQKGMKDLMPVFMFAAWRDKKEFAGGAVTSTTTYAVTGNTGAGAVIANSLVYVEGYVNSENNGLHVITSLGSTTSLITSGLVNETAPAAATITKVGQQFASGDVTVTTHAEGATIGCTAGDFTKLNLIPGEWIFVGGDDAATRFATAADNGWYRVKSVTATAIVCDRVPGTIVNDTGTSKTIRIFIGHVIKNESDPDLIVRSSIQLERAFGSGLDPEYLLGQVGSTLDIDIRSGRDSQVRCSMGFMGTTASREAEKAGDRPAMSSESGFTGSNDFARLRLQREDTDATIATYVETLKISINNNCSYNKAIGVLGAWEITVGDFAVMAEADCFFASHAAADAIEANADVSLDFAMCTNNAGWLMDIPLISLSDGRPNVAKDASVKLPLSADGAAHATLDHTLLAMQFPYLPDLAE